MIWIQKGSNNEFLIFYLSELIEKIKNPFYKEPSKLDSKGENQNV